MTHRSTSRPIRVVVLGIRHVSSAADASSAPTFVATSAFLVDGPPSERAVGAAGRANQSPSAFADGERRGT
ncbi:hypothetical protein [Agrococcus sp. Ld7]|uniref:hypothetical protein n=1 Tax=Agrococcus sp. Ld7 TaxID=649148 RepID=UPI003868E1C2